MKKKKNVRICQVDRIFLTDSTFKMLQRRILSTPKSIHIIITRFYVMYYCFRWRGIVGLASVAATNLEKKNGRQIHRLSMSRQTTDIPYRSTNGQIALDQSHVCSEKLYRFFYACKVANFTLLLFKKEYTQKRNVENYEIKKYRADVAVTKAVRQDRPSVIFL